MPFIPDYTTQATQLNQRISPLSWLLWSWSCVRLMSWPRLAGISPMTQHITTPWSTHHDPRIMTTMTATSSSDIEPLSINNNCNWFTISPWVRFDSLNKTGPKEWEVQYTSKLAVNKFGCLPLSLFPPRCRMVMPESSPTLRGICPAHREKYGRFWIHE